MIKLNNFQNTLKQTVSFSGTGLHNGLQSRITLKPSTKATGIFFRRMDVPYQESLIPARWNYITDTSLSTVLTNYYGHSVSTIEHLMSALRICQIDNVEIQVFGHEIPIMDGSAKPFIDTLLHAGTKLITAPAKVIYINKKVKVNIGEQSASISPDNQARITMSIDFKAQAIGRQSLTVEMNNLNMADEIAPARTFGLLEQIKNIQHRGLALGGNLSNAILVDNAQIVNPEGLRFKDEFVRHKILDAIGDLALSGAAIIGHYQAFKGSHSLNALLMKTLFTDKTAWSCISRSDLEFFSENNRQSYYPSYPDRMPCSM